MNYRDMTEEQRLAWGETERQARIVDLKVRGADGLKAAQDNAKARRSAIGATVSQANTMVTDASRLARRRAAGF